MVRRLWAWGLAGSCLGGCAASRALAPLEKGQHGVTLSVGGPFVEFGGAPIPLPITQVGYRYGIDGLTDVHAGLYLTNLALFGVGGFDVGFARQLVDADGPRPRVMVDLTTYWFFGDLDGDPDGSPGGFRMFPDLQLVATWDLPHRDDRRPHRLYVGLDNWVQPFPEFRYYLNPFLGTELRLTKLAGLQLEAGWYAPWVPTRDLNPVWYGPGDLGAISVKLGFQIYVPERRVRAARRVEAP